MPTVGDLRIEPGSGAVTAAVGGNSPTPSGEVVGPTGPAGPPGAIGPTGPAGTSGTGAPAVLINFFNTDPDGTDGETITVNFTVTGSNIASGGMISIGSDGRNVNDNSPLFVFDSVISGTQSIITPFSSNGYGLGYYMVYVTNDVGTGWSSIFSIMNGECFVEGTMITMADWSKKAIENITYDDMILVWDFDNKKYSTSHPIWIKIEETTNTYNLLKFSDGSELRTVGNHHIFNKSAERFTHTMRDDTPIGTTSINLHGEEVTLVAAEKIHETVKQYNVWTEYHLNMFADGILTSNRFNNTYPIVDMQFVKTDEHLRTMAEFDGIDSRWIEGLRLREQTDEHSQEYIHWYISRLERKQKLVEQKLAA